MRALKSVLFPIHPEGFRFIAIFAFLTLLFCVGLIGLGFGYLDLVVRFFRDPLGLTAAPRTCRITGGCVVNMITGAGRRPKACDEYLPHFCHECV